MLLVSASLKPSPIHGLGCFTNEKIEKGQVVWVLDRRIDLIMPVYELASLPKAIQDYYHMYGYVTVLDGQKVVVMSGDHSKHMNHSSTPNVIEHPSIPHVEIAARDIEPGEELTCDYYSFDLDARRKLGGVA